MGHRSLGRWWRRRSLRARVTLGATAVVMLGVALVAAGILLGVRRSLIAGVDNAALQRATDVAGLAAHGGIRGTIPFSGSDTAAVQVLDAAGAPIAATPDLNGNEPIVPVPLPESLRAGTPATVTDLPVGAGGDYRVVAVPAQLNGAPATVVVAQSLAEEQRSFAGLVAGLAMGLPVIVALVAATTWAVTGATLRPVNSLRREVDQISATDVQHRLELPGSQDEIHQLATTLNAMLGRLALASQAQRQFVADAAHELRTPLTAAIVDAETAASAADPQAWASLGPVLLTDLRRLGDLVDDLLALAHLDDPGYRARWRALDLDDVVLAELQRARQAGRLVDGSNVEAARVTGDPTAMTRVVRNLVDNAVRHAATRVGVALEDGGKHVTLSVFDDGPGIPAADRQRVFDRFARLNPARDRGSGGTGLGLAIVRELVGAHGGRVWVSDPPDDDRGRAYPGAWVLVELPGADDPGAQAPGGQTPAGQPPASRVTG
jgi:signal transduction histidine kinase